MLKCGFYETDITPALGGDMPGYFTCRHTTTIRDTLYAKAFAVQAQGDPIVIVVLDALMVEQEDADRIREGIGTAVGIPASNVAVGATHIHTGGAVISLYDSKRDGQYCDFMVQRAVNAGIMAFQRMEDARMGVAARNVEGIAFSRRFLMEDGTYATNPGLNPRIVKPVDVTDPELVVIRIDKMDGTPMGIIANYALHTDTVNEKGYGYCADYPGRLRQKIRKAYGEDVFFMFLQGTSGNVNHINISVGIKEQKCYNEIAQILFAAIDEMCGEMRTSDVEKVVCTSCVRSGFTRSPSKAECDAARETKPILLKEMLPVMDLPPQEKQFEIWSAMIGEVAIHMLPGELFARFGLDIKAQDGCRYTMNGELSNVSLGYIYTREAQQQGGYESTPSTYVRMNSDTGYTIVEGAVANIKKLKEM